MEKLIERYLQLGWLIDEAEGEEKLKLKTEQFNLLFYIQSKMGLIQGGDNEKEEGRQTKED